MSCRNWCARANAGDEVEIEIRREGKIRTVDVTIGKLKEERHAEASTGDDTDSDASEVLGATLATLTPDARANLGLEDKVEGVVVTSVKAGGAAAKAGLDVGDVIVRLGDAPVAQPSDVKDALAEGENKAALMLINRPRHGNLCRGSDHLNKPGPADGGLDPFSGFAEPAE